MILKFSRKKSPVHGWGLFADEFIPFNTIIEECSYVKMEVVPSPLSTYRFGCPEIGNAIILGYANLINSSLENPNVKFKFENDLFYIYSIKDIEVGEELFLKYL
jgi:SET domain-containing protein